MAVTPATTLTRAQILARGAMTGDAGGGTVGGRTVAPGRGKPPPVKPRTVAPPVAPPDPYDQIIAGLPQPQTPGQIGQTAQSEISPLLAALTGTVNAQAQNAQHAIQGYSADAASKLAGIDWGAPYRQAESGQAAIDSALQQSLTGAGSSDAAALASRLGVINDPSVAAAAGGLASSGAAAGTTALANGSANLGSLLSNAASADSYGQKQPELTRLAAEQQIATAGAQAQQTIATDAANLEQQLPGIIQNLTSRSDSAATTIATARENQLSRNDNIASGMASNTLKVQTINANNATKLQIAQMNAQGKVTAEQMTQARSDRTYALQFAKTYGYNPVTGQLAANYTRGPNGTIVKVSPGGGAHGGTNGVPPSTYAGLKEKANKAADLFYYGQQPVTRADGTVSKAGIPGVTYQVAIRQLMRGYSLTRADALAIANTYYPPGQRGRPGGTPKAPKPSAPGLTGPVG